MFGTFISVWKMLTAAALSKVYEGLFVHGCPEVDTELGLWEALIWCSGDGRGKGEGRQWLLVFDCGQLHHSRKAGHSCRGDEDTGMWSCSLILLLLLRQGHPCSQRPEADSSSSPGSLLPSSTLW